MRINRILTVDVVHIRPVTLVVLHVEVLALFVHHAQSFMLAGKVSTRVACHLLVQFWIDIFPPFDASQVQLVCIFVQRASAEVVHVPCGSDQDKSAAHHANPVDGLLLTDDVVARLCVLPGKGQRTL